MRWVEIINVMINSDGFTLIIKDGSLIGMKHFDVDFCKKYNPNDTNSFNELLTNILDYSDSMKYTDPSLAELTRNCIDVLVDNMGVGCWVRDDFYFKEVELCR